MGSHGLRVFQFLKYLDEYGWKIEALTIKPSSTFPFLDKNSIKGLPKSINIHRVYAGFFSKLFYKSQISFKNNKNSVGNKSKLVTKLSGYISELNICRILDWTPFAIIKGLRLTFRNTCYNIMVSSGRSDPHLITYLIKKFNKNLLWIVDYGDPWVFEPTYNHTKLRFLIEHFLEKKILKNSDLIIVTTEETRMNYLRNYTFLPKEKIKVIPMGTDYSQFNKIKPESSKKFRILYTGSIYPTRDIKPFLYAIKSICKNREIAENIEVLFVGNIEQKHKNRVIEMKLETIVRFNDYVSYNKSLSLIKGADLLISFGNTGGVQVPGKLFDYIGSKKPILWIKGDNKDPALSFFKNVNRVIVCNNKDSDICSNIVMLYDFYTQNKLHDQFDLNEIPEFSWKYRVEILDKLCRTLINNK